jgi:2-polyprenyl-3-methyl-5-hydroxy-6-metoxy-1,4-benzoquinol methylase
MLISSAHLFNPRQWKYQWRYLRGKAPWETGQTPDEVIEFISTHPPGKAIDLGCGMGTHALTLARSGWEVTGIDFAALVIRIARTRAARQGLRVKFVQGDVTRPGRIHGPYDFALDVGCLFSLNSDERAAYAGQLSRLLRPGA